MKFKPIAILCTFVLVLNMTVAANAYNHVRAQQYADIWVDSYNPAFVLPSGGDCANFVSQCMDDGGLPMDTTWYHEVRENQEGEEIKYGSMAWVNANSLKEYIKAKGGTLLGRWMRETQYNKNGVKYNGYINNSSNIAGLGSEIVFYDFQGDGIMDHCSIIVGTNRPYILNGADDGGPIYITDPTDEIGDLIDAHTSARKHQYWHLDEHNVENRDTTQVYCYRLNV